MLVAARREERREEGEEREGEGVVEVWVWSVGELFSRDVSWGCLSGLFIRVTRVVY